MMSSNEYQNLTERTKTLLSGVENYDVDFKEELSGLKPVDFVAFANSDTGGAMLIGVKDTKDEDGRQVGVVVGCKISDEAKLSIISRAVSCIPSINVEVFVENLADKPIYRIEIPSGKNKPYCTAGGKYKIRGDASNLPLHPTRLLSMFMEIESNKFLDKFNLATIELEKNFSEAMNNIMKRVDESQQSVEDLKRILTLDKENGKNIKNLISTIENVSCQNENSDDQFQKELEEIREDLGKIVKSLSAMEIYHNNGIKEKS